VLKPDKKRLLVAESLRNSILEFQLIRTDSLSKPRIFATLPSEPNQWTNGEAEPDGIALDERGNLYVAHFGAGEVSVFDQSGTFLRSLNTGLLQSQIWHSGSLKWMNCMYTPPMVTL
jgi:gluconolactonase